MQQWQQTAAGGATLPPTPHPSLTLLSPPSLPPPPSLSARTIFFFCICFSSNQPEGVYFFLRLTGMEASWLYYLEELPTLIILTLLTQQVLALSKSYYVSIDQAAYYSACVERAAIAGNVAVVLVQVCLWGVYFGARSSGSIDPDVVSVAAASLHACCFLLCGAAMCYYGLANSAKVRALALDQRQRLSLLKELAVLYVPCTVAFVLRAVALAGASYANLLNYNSVRDSVDSWDAAASILVYVFTELLPLWTILRYYRPRAPRAAASLPLELRSPKRFTFSPTRRAHGKGPGAPASGGERAAALAEPAGAQQGAAAAGTISTARALWMLGSMARAAVGLGSSSSSSSSSSSAVGGASERTRLLGDAGGRARLGLAPAPEPAAEQVVLLSQQPSAADAGGGHSAEPQASV